MKPLHETTPQHIRRVCVGQATNQVSKSSSRFSTLTVLLLILSVVTVGVIVAHVIIGLVGGYADLLHRLSRGF